jgi:histone-lysine N-methyltransferase SETMAR
LTTNKLAELGWEHLEHPPYSPDLAPSDFHLFRALEHFLRGKRFENIGEMRVSLGQFFDSKPQDFYRRGIYLLPEKWQQVIDVDGEYFD